MAAKVFIEERRLFARFKFSEGCLVVTQNMIGLLEDMSLGGASFQYFDKGRCGLDGSTPFEIVLPFGQILVKAGHYEVVESNSQNGTASAACQAQIMRCHMHFIDLTATELQNLWQTIKVHCVRSWAPSTFKPTYCCLPQG